MSILAHKLNAVARHNIAMGPGYSLPTPLLLQSFDSTSGFSTTNFPRQAIDTVNKVEGLGALRLGGSGSISNPTTTRLNIANLDPAGLGVVACYMRPPLHWHQQDFSNLLVKLGRSGSWHALTRALSRRHTGPQWYARHVQEIGSLASIGAGQIDLQLEETITWPFAGQSNYDALVANAAGRTKIVLTFDDSYVQQLSVAAPILSARGIRAGSYVVKDRLGDSGKLTIAQCDTLYHTHGWDMGVDGTTDDGDMTALPSVTDAVNAFLAGRQFCLDHGWTRGADHGCYPNGTYGVNGTIIEGANSTRNGSAVITGIDSTTGVVPGMLVWTDLAPDLVRVVSVDSATQVTVDANMPARSGRIAFIDDSGPFYYGKLASALSAAGAKSFRTGEGGTIHDRFGLPQPMLIPGQTTTGATFSSFKALVDTAILRGSSIVFLFHAIVPGGGGVNIDTDVFQDCMTYLADRRDAGTIDIPTPSQYYRYFKDRSFSLTETT